MKRSPGALALLALWIATLAALGWTVQRTLTLGTDLRLFLPSPTTPEQRLLLEEIGEGPAARVLVLALAGAPAEELAETSRTLVDTLHESERFRFVTNGELSLDALPEPLLAYRYLLSPTLDSQSLDAEHLRAEIEARARDLSSPAGAFLEPWMARDPTLELLKVLQSWQPTQEPRREYDVWFDRRGERALLLAETKAAAFDPEQQRLAIDAIREALHEIDPAGEVRATISGSGQFSVMMEERTRADAQRLGALASIGMALLVLIAYRRPGSILLSALPLASAALAGLAAVAVAFEAVHGITLAFGFTLIGVAQDYPIHLLSHRRDDRDAYKVARSLWPALATGVASTCIAYLTFLFSGVVGLQQLACFTVAGLAAAGLTTRFALPALVADDAPDAAQSSFVVGAERVFGRTPRPLIVALVLGALCATLLLRADQPFWENDLSKLTPVPPELLAQDQALRSQLGAADVRYLLIVRAHTQQEVLRRLEALDASMRKLVDDGVIAGYDHAARYLPSLDVQRRRQARLSDAPTLRLALQEAVAQSPFRPDAFEPFVIDVAAARELPPFTPERLGQTPLAPTLEALLREREGEALGLVTFSGVSDARALAPLAASGDATLLDLKAASESLVAEQRERILWSLAVGAVLLVVIVIAALRDVRRAARVLAPMALTTLVVLAVLQGAGVSLTLFHLIALILAAGLGLDYALFFEHAAHDAAEQRRTLHAILICSASTLMVFALLATSSLPVLQAIGATVSIGVVSNFALAWVVTRKAPLVAGPRPTASNPLARSGPLSSGQSAAVQQPLSSLIPHQGGMCLLERVIEWDEQRIVLESNTHRATTNPLRENGRLRAVHLCEYGAQAMAVHGALRAQATTQPAAPGMLVSLRGVKFSRDYVDDLPGALRVEADCLQASETSLQYAFRVLHADEVLAEGRAAVVLGKQERPTTKNT